MRVHFSGKLRAMGRAVVAVTVAVSIATAALETPLMRAVPVFADVPCLNGGVLIAASSVKDSVNNVKGTVGLCGWTTNTPYGYVTARYAEFIHNASWSLHPTVEVYVIGDPQHGYPQKECYTDINANCYTDIVSAYAPFTAAAYADVDYGGDYYTGRAPPSGYR